VDEVDVVVEPHRRPCQDRGRRAHAVTQPEGLSNKTPSLKVMWDKSKLGVSGDLVARALLDGEPRVALFAQRGDSPSDTGVSITPYMLLPGDAQIVADRLAAVLAHRHSGTRRLRRKRRRRI
jgi:hypothetical protein